MPNLFTRWLERRSLATPSRELLALFSSGPTESGLTVTPEAALSVPAVFACCQVLSQDVARTPIKFREQVGPDTYEDAVDHPLSEILGSLWNPEQTAYQAKAALMWSLLTFGRAYAEIVRAEGRVVALWPLRSDQMQVDRTPGRVKRWTYYGGGQPVVWLFDASQPPILELTSPSPVQVCRELLGTALATNTYLAKFFANNARPAGVLTVPVGSPQAQTDRIAALWKTGYGGVRNAWGTPVLEGGLSYTPIASNNEDAQLAELTKHLTEQIAGVFRVPPTKIGDLSKANYSNVVAMQQTYVTDCLDPYFQLWEEAIRRDVLTTRQYGRYTATFDRHALVRNDVTQLHTSLSSGIQNGYLSQNDARKALGMNPIPGGDVYLVNSALQPVGAPPEVPGV